MGKPMKNTHTYTHTHTYIHTHIHTHIYTHIHIHIHTHTYTHTHTIETYGPAPRLQPTNTNIWPHNSRATAAPSRLADSFVLQVSFYSLLIRSLTNLIFASVRTDFGRPLSGGSR